MSSNQEKAVEVIVASCTCDFCEVLEDPGESCPYCRRDATQVAHTLADAGLLAGEYIELAPKNRLGIGGAKDHVIISDNTTRTTIKIPYHLVDGLIASLLMIQSHQEEKPNV